MILALRFGKGFLNHSINPITGFGFGYMVCKDGFFRSGPDAPASALNPRIFI